MARKLLDIQHPSGERRGLAMKKNFVFLTLMAFFACAFCCEAQEQAVPDKQKITDELFAAAEKGDFETVKNLLTEYPDMKDVRRNGGWTLLHLSFGSRELVEYLIENGADIEARSDSQWTPLHSQAYGGHLAGVELLLEHGAEIEAKHAYDMTPLISSVRWDRIDVAKLLVEKGANVDAPNTLGRTPLIISATEGYSELAKIFLDNGADITTKDNNYKRTALHFAALNGHLKIVDALLKKGADLDEKDAAGKTPLEYANRYGHEKVARLLKSSGAKGEIDPRYFGYTPYLKKPLNEGEAFAWNMGRVGYAVKTKNHFLLFGYSILGNLPEEPRLVNGHIDLDEIADCRTIVFAGGPEYWHHNPKRYSRWQKTHKNISFIYSFEDKLGRNPNYFEDVEGPEYIYVPDGQKKIIEEMRVETIPVSRGSGFLVEVDGLTIFYGGDHLMFNESQRDSFRKVIDYVKGTGKEIDILILSANFLYGRIFPGNLEGVEYAVKTLEPKACLAMSASESTEFVLSEVVTTLEKYKNQTQVFCPEHRGDMFILKH
jgi:ankyrin repeat protein